MRTETLSPATSQPTDDRCQRCGGALAEDQEWCLECGAARTRLRPPPDWRWPVAITLGLVVLAVVALVVVLISLSA